MGLSDGDEAGSARGEWVTGNGAARFARVAEGESPIRASLCWAGVPREGESGSILFRNAGTASDAPTGLFPSGPGTARARTICTSPKIP